MDPQLLDREKEFMKINSKLNAKSKKHNSVNKTNNNPIVATKPIQIITSNHHFNYYEEEPQQIVHVPEGLELRCQRMNFTNHQYRKPGEISYPKSISRRKLTLDVHIPDSFSVDSNRSGIDSDTTNCDSTTTDITFQHISELTDSFKERRGFPNIPLRESLRSSRIHKSQTDSSLQMNSSDVSTYRSVPTVDTENGSKAEVKTANAEGLLKFLKSKVALVQTELDAAKTLNQQLEKDNEKQEKRIKKMTSQLDKYNKKIEAIEANNCKLEEKICNLQNELQDKKSEISEVTQNLRETEEELSTVITEKNSLEKSLLKANRDLEISKTKIENYQEVEKNTRESHQKEIRTFEDKLRNLQKSKLSLLKAYKQQIVLIDNLKRQNLCLQKAKVLEICEKEFLKVLNWNFADTD